MEIGNVKILEREKRVCFWMIKKNIVTHEQTE